MTYVWGGAKKLKAEGYIVADESSERDDRLFIITFLTSQRIYLLIAFIALLASYTLGYVYIQYIIRDMYKPEYIIAWFIYGASISLNIYYSYWSISLRSVGAIRQSQKATILGTIVQLIVSYIGLLLEGGIVALSIATCLCGITIRFISRAYFSRLNNIGSILKKYSNSIKKEELSETFKIIWYNAKRAGISSIATVAMTQSTTLICSAYLGIKIAGEYGLCMQLLGSLSGVAQIYYQTTIPQLTQSRQRNNLLECQKQFSLSVTIAWGIFVFGFIIAVLFGNALLVIIKSRTSLNIRIFVIMSICTFGEMNYSIHASFISLENKLPFVSSVVITAILVIALSFLGVYAKLGILGIIGMRCIAEISYIFWKWPKVAHQELKMRSLDIIYVGMKELYLKICRVF